MSTIIVHIADKNFTYINPAMDITPSQIRAARGLLDLSQQDLAEAANVGLSTVRSFESGKRTPIANNLQAIRAALESAGVIFIDQNGNGPGVRLKDRQG